jgi:hypothetical protein
MEFHELNFVLLDSALYPVLYLSWFPGKVVVTLEICFRLGTCERHRDWVSSHSSNRKHDHLNIVWLSQHRISITRECISPHLAESPWGSDVCTVCLDMTHLLCRQEVRYTLQGHTTLAPIPSPLNLVYILTRFLLTLSLAIRITQIL